MECAPLLGRAGAPDTDRSSARCPARTATSRPDRERDPARPCGRRARGSRIEQGPLLAVSAICTARGSPRRSAGSTQRPTNAGGSRDRLLCSL